MTDAGNRNDADNAGPTLDPAPSGYAEAVDELESILDEIEGSAVDVDVLAARVQRAAGLIEWCRERIVAATDAVADATKTLGQD